MACMSTELLCLLSPPVLTPFLELPSVFLGQILPTFKILTVMGMPVFTLRDPYIRTVRLLPKD